MDAPVLQEKLAGQTELRGAEFASFRVCKVRTVLPSFLPDLAASYNRFRLLPHDAAARGRRREPSSHIVIMLRDAALYLGVVASDDESANLVSLLIDDHATQTSRDAAQTPRSGNTLHDHIKWLPFPSS